MLFPNAPTKVDLKKWGVVACDQFTSQPEYWEKAARTVGNNPSTLDLIYPEVYLNEPEEQKTARINRIHATMDEYIKNGVLQESQWPVLVERSVLGRVHWGLVIAIDLEAYSFDPHLAKHALIRPTEMTIPERIPPRVRVRKGAALECPHILLLIDDPKHTIIEPLAHSALHGQLGQEMYQTELMLDGGKVRGWTLPAGPIRDQLFQGLQDLTDPTEQRQKYGDEVDVDHPLLFAVGDGNHSLATAKAVWEETKSLLPPGTNTVDHPARCALAEINNVHDDAIIFEPIHRIFSHCGDPSKILEDIKKLGGSRVSFSLVPEGAEKVVKMVREHGNVAPHMIGFVSAQLNGIITIANPTASLAVASIQPILDQILSRVDKQQPQHLEIDFVHDDDVLRQLGSQPGHCGFALPCMAKSELFKAVISSGVVPRKTFSMGHATEKRYYMECRKIL